MKYKLFILIFICHYFGFGQTPKLTGNVYVSLSNGQITCDFEITNFPILKDPAICLNRGLNIKDLKLNSTSIDYNIDWGFPGRTIFLSEGVGIIPNIDTLVNTSKISIDYTGAFPTYTKNEEIASGDGMSLIAIKNNIIRASHQSLWYPVLVDRVNNFTVSKYEYDIKVICKDCESIYLGGTDPIKSSKGVFKTTEPNDIMLYAGKYNFIKAKNTFFLNSSLDKNRAEVLSTSLDSIKSFYTKILKTEYTQPTVLAQIFSIGPKKQYEKWAFVVYPCIVADLNNLSAEIDREKNQISDINTFRVYSHELAHNFFGLKLKADNEFWGFYSESFAEYFCLKAIEKFFGKEKYVNFLSQRYLNDKALSMKFTSLTNIKSDINAYHLYNYYPMLLVGLEQLIGQERMYKLCEQMLHTTTTTNLTLSSLKNSATAIGITTAEWADFENNYINSENCLPLIKSNFEKGMK